MEKEFDLISVGDSTIDIFMGVDLADTEVHCSLDEKKCIICFEWGAKIPTRGLTRVPGVGNAANNAIGSARLGLKTGIYTVTGSDKDSNEIKEVLENEGVDTQFVVMENGKRSNLSVVINYDTERNIFVYHEQRKYNLPDLPPARWMYFTSVGKNHEILNKQIPEYVKKYDVKLGFNPGTYQLRTGLETLKPVLQVTEVLLLNREEANMLVDGDIEDVKGMVKTLLSHGPKIVVVTDGQNGSYASFDGREFWQAGIVKSVPVIERTGAGDAYSTGFLAALLHEKNLPEAMIWGTMNAASVIQHVGAREGLLTKEKMEEYVAKYGEEVKPKMI